MLILNKHYIISIIMHFPTLYSVYSIFLIIIFYFTFDCFKILGLFRRHTLKPFELHFELQIKFLFFHLPDPSP